MPQNDPGPETRQDSNAGLNGATLSDSTNQAAFDSSAHANGVGNGSTMPGGGPKGSATQRNPAESPLETALTRMGRQSPWQESRGVANSHTMEYFRRIYLSLHTSGSPDTIPTIGVTSAVDGEGKSTIALGIATTIAADLDSPIVLVELNLTRPSVHKSLGIPAQPGLSEYLRGECSLPNALRQITENLFVLPAGDCRNDPARLIRMLTRANLLLRMDNSGAVLVLDLPPVLTASYGVLASSMADAVVLVVRAGQTPEKMVKDAVARLDESTLRGIVLNAARPSIPTWLGGYV
ncbi:MAG TPA: CpsD/CapB family tyrosine-protein kinase [Ktedonobacterales bacterium]|jgi:Mrp family chromosome partitioning ATPase